MDLRFQSIQSPDYDIRLSLSEFVIATVSFSVKHGVLCFSFLGKRKTKRNYFLFSFLQTSKASPWTINNVQVLANGRRVANISAVLIDFTAWVNQAASQLPEFDHAVLFTRSEPTHCQLPFVRTLHHACKWTENALPSNTKWDTVLSDQMTSVLGQNNGRLMRKKFSSGICPSKHVSAARGVDPMMFSISLLLLGVVPKQFLQHFWALHEMLVCSDIFQLFSTRFQEKKVLRRAIFLRTTTQLCVNSGFTYSLDLYSGATADSTVNKIGQAAVGRICQYDRVSIAEDQGLFNSGFTATHELAHK